MFLFRQRFNVKGEGIHVANLSFVHLISCEITRSSTLISLKVYPLVTLMAVTGLVTQGKLWRKREPQSPEPTKIRLQVLSPRRQGSTFAMMSYHRGIPNLEDHPKNDQFLMVFNNRFLASPRLPITPTPVLRGDEPAKCTLQTQFTHVSIRCNLPSIQFLHFVVKHQTFILVRASMICT